MFGATRLKSPLGLQGVPFFLLLPPVHWHCCHWGTVLLDPEGLPLDPVSISGQFLPPRTFLLSARPLSYLSFLDSPRAAFSSFTILSVRSSFHSYRSKCHLCADGPPLYISVAQTSFLSTADLKSQLPPLGYHRDISDCAWGRASLCFPSLHSLPFNKWHCHLPRCPSWKHRNQLWFIFISKP